MTNQEKTQKQPTQEEILAGLSIDELKATEEKLKGAIARKIEYDNKQKLQAEENDRLQIAEAQRIANEKQNKNNIKQQTRPMPVYDAKIEDDENRQPAIKIRGRAVAYDASNEPIEDKPKGGFMSIIGNPILLIVMMIVISWAVVQIFGASSGGSSSSKIGTAVNMLETQRGQDLASITTLQGNFKDIQSSIATLNTTVSNLPKSTDTTGSITTINNQLKSLQTEADTDTSNLTALTSSVATMEASITALQKTVNGLVTPAK